VAVETSLRAFKKARKHIAHGVNSPVRAFVEIGGTPVFVESAKGSHIKSIDGKTYLDFCLSWGALIHGHADPDVVGAVKNAAEKGTGFGCPTNAETFLAQLVKGAFPSIETLRFVSSGTEAVMSAVRLARGYTGRDKIIKFDGCYHGHSDSMLVAAGSGAARAPKASSAGVPAGTALNTISIPFNDIQILEKILYENIKDVAAVIMEPIPANMGLVLPRDGFLEAVRKITQKLGVLLIFDEVISGFRVAYGGAQEYYGITPDLTCLGKITGGGLPAAAFGGKKEIMDHLAPYGDVYQAGTLSGNPVAMAAGIAAISKLKRPGFYEDLNLKTEYIREAFGGFKDAKIVSIGSMFTVFFGGYKPLNFEDVKKTNAKSFKKWHGSMLRAGFYLPPSRFETCFISAAHTQGQIDSFITKGLKILG
jgi:glutamate-1-semialdehyde 2,1-aminomutase